MLEENNINDFEKILKENDFTEYDKSIDTEIKEVDSLFLLIKDILLKEVNGSVESDRPLRLGTAKAFEKKNTRFISDLVSNLTNIKTLKLNLEKQRTDNKRDYLNRILKVLSETNKLELNQKSSSGNYNELLNFILTNTSLQVEPSSMSFNCGNDIDHELDKILLEEESITKKETKISSKKRFKSYDVEGNFLAYSVQDEKLFLLSPDYSVVREVMESEVEVEEDGEIFFDSKSNCIIEVLS